MEQRILGKTGFSVSIITFGGIVVDGMEEKEASAIVSESVRQGVTQQSVILYT
jgi:aryl-alcohol dehydrogenase-like predicted oxidoreductase